MTLKMSKVAVLRKAARIMAARPQASTVLSIMLQLTVSNRVAILHSSQVDIHHSSRATDKLRNLAMAKLHRNNPMDAHHLSLAGIHRSKVGFVLYGDHRDIRRPYK